LFGICHFQCFSASYNTFAGEIVTAKRKHVAPRGVWQLACGLLLAIANRWTWAQVANDTIARTQTSLQPQSVDARLIQELSFFVLSITGAIFAVVGGLWLYVIIKYRERSGDEENEEPPQVYGSTQIELAWTVIPVLIVVVLFLTAARILFAIQDQPIPANAIHVDVVGHQYWWEFRYPGYSFVTANELHVPIGQPAGSTTTDLNILSADVDHSFWVPSLAGKIDTVPNKPNRISFDPTKTGVYEGQCAQFCGTAHAQMLLRVYVQTPEDFAAWVKSQQGEAAEDPAAAQGRQVFESQACVSCHTVRGTAAHGLFGPDLTHLMSRDTLASGLIPNTAANLKLWIKNPETIKPGSLMPAMQLSDQEIDQMVAYLSTLK
jgi:cytochrome c oxidase subunit II